MRRKTTSPNPQPAQLSAEEIRVAIPKLKRRIEELNAFDPDSVNDFSDPRPDSLQQKIDGTLVEILGPDTLDYQRYYFRSLYQGAMLMGGTPPSKIRAGYRNGKADALSKLQTLVETLEEKLEDLGAGLSSQSGLTGYLPSQVQRVDRTKVFIVHGHDEAARETVARFLERLQVEPVILHEQADRGRTIIEKLEHYGRVGFAVVLLTPDDEGRKARSDDPLQPRARQNVLLELGFFVGLLGRERVCALHKGAVEIPSDYVGVVYVAFDDAGGWRLRLAKELKAAGFDIDMNLAV